MTTPNPALVAAGPIILAIISELKAFTNTVLTGDPLQAPARLDGAGKVLLGNVELQLIGLIPAEVSVVQADINAGWDSLTARVQTAIAPAGAATAATK